MQIVYIWLLSQTKCTKSVPKRENLLKKVKKDKRKIPSLTPHSHSPLFLRLFCATLLSMSITQTLEVPASRRLVVNVPLEIPVGPVILTFTPATAKSPAPPAKPRMTEEEEMAIFELHAEEMNREAMDSFLDQIDLWDPSLPPSAEVLDESLVKRREP